MDAEDFQLAVIAIILLQRVRKRKFKRNARMLQWVRAKFKDREEGGAKWKNYKLLLKFSSSFKLHYIYLFSQCS